MKLLVGVPSLDFVHVEFVKSLVALQARLQADGIRHDVWICSGTLAHVARDRVACKAINEGYTHVLWLDADMVFTPDILDDLSFCGKPFVTGLAANRRPPFVLCVFKELTCPYQKFQLSEVGSEPFRIAGCGFACVLIKTDILKAVQMQYGTCFLPEMTLGEDLAFCQRAASLGYEIWCDPSVRVGHIGHNAIWPDDVERLTADLKAKGGRGS